MSAPRARRSTEPASRAGILAAGLVRIVRTPAELDAEKGWWCPERSNVYPDVRRARREAMKAVPHWLRPPVTPAETVRRMFRDATSERQAAIRYIGDRRPTPVPLMTPTQLRSALATEYRRLARGWDDTATLDVTVEPPDPATLDILTAPTPEPTPAPTPEPVPEPTTEPVPAVVVASITPSGTVTHRRAPAPEPPPAPAPWKPRGRDRLAWVPVMRRLAEMYASRAPHPDPDGPEAA